MVIHTDKIETIYNAINALNKIYDGNIKMPYAPRYLGKDKSGLEKYRLVLRTFDSSAAGSTRSASGRRTSSACWHAHGHFFEYIIAFGGYIEARDKKIKSKADNWQDYNIGNLYNPCLASEACDCTE